MNALLDHALKIAVFFCEGGQLPTVLPVRDGFPSFGVGVDTAGELLEFNCLPSPGGPGLFDVFAVRDQLAHFVSPDETHPQFQKELAGRTLQDAPIPVGFVADAMKQCAAQGGIHAAALVDRVEVPPAKAGGSKHAIRVQFEHVEGKRANCYQPYTVMDNRVLCGERWMEPGKSLVFG